VNKASSVPIRLLKITSHLPRGQLAEVIHSHTDPTGMIGHSPNLQLCTCPTLDIKFQLTNNSSKPRDNPDTILDNFFSDAESKNDQKTIRGLLNRKEDGEYSKAVQDSGSLEGGNTLQHYLKRKLSDFLTRPRKLISYYRLGSQQNTTVSTETK